MCGSWFFAMRKRDKSLWRKYTVWGYTQARDTWISPSLRTKWKWELALKLGEMSSKELKITLMVNYMLMEWDCNDIIGRDINKTKAESW